MPRTKEQNMAIRAEKRQLIMDSALHLFAENGFENTSIDCITKSAGISKGLLYAYFESKDDLLHRILAEGLQTATSNFNPDMTMESFIAGIEKSFDHIAENRDFYKLYTTISVQPKVTKNLNKIVGEKNFHSNTALFFQKQFGEKAMQEMILYSVIAKGYAIIAAFADGQNVLSVDMLKKVVVDFIKERYKQSVELKS
jgi:AcrR family transcriptional regulator